MPNGNKLAKAAAFVMIITVASKFLGFFRDILLAANYGTTYQTDAYILSQTVPGLIMNIVIAALGTTFIPVISDYLFNKNKDVTNKFINAVYTVVIVLSLAICVLGIIFAPFLTRLVAPNFGEKEIALTVTLTRITFPLIITTIVYTLNNCLLQSHQKFVIPALIGYPQNLILILTMVFFTNQFGIVGLAYAGLLAGIIQIIIQIPSIRRLNFTFNFDFNLKDEGLKSMGLLIIPIMIGSGVQQIEILINRSLASGLAEGSIAALSFSSRITLFEIGVFITAISTVCFPSLSYFYSSGELEKFKKLVLNALNIVSIIIVPNTVIFISLRFPILKVLFERGSFDSNATMLTAEALMYYSIGLIGFGFRDIINSVFYSLKDTKTPMINGIITVIICITLNLLLVRYMGIGGLALATSLSALISGILLIKSLQTKLGSLGFDKFLITLFKSLLAGLISGVLIYYLNIILNSVFINKTDYVDIIILVVNVCIYFVCYYIFIWLLKVDELKMINEIIISKTIKRIKIS